MKKQQGFTLVELVIVVALLGVVTALAIPGANMIKKHRVRSAAMELSSNLQKLRSDSITSSSGGTSRGFGVRFESPDSYSLFEFDDCNGDYRYDDDTCSGGGSEAKNSVVSIFPSDVYLTRKDSTAITGEVMFYDRRGMARGEGWSTKDLTVLVRHRDSSLKPRCVAISSVRIREGYWNAGTSECD
jgi:prepilin-type N-terminal cleavage/methylation domain-containing protein